MKALTIFKRTFFIVLLLNFAGLPLLAQEPDQEQEQEQNQEQDQEQAQQGQKLVYEIEASNAFVARETTGNVTEDVKGVPAEPVDSFTWDGQGYESVEADLTARLDPINNSGYIEVTWQDKHGEWKLKQTKFSESPMPIGVRFGPSIEEKEEIKDSVIANLYMHGDTGAVDEMLPTLFAYIGTWGEAEVTLNGEPFENPYGGPAPNWTIHAMLVTGVYDEEGKVNLEGEGAFDQNQADKGKTDFADLEYQIIFFDEPGANTESIPPEFNFAYHLIFEDVTAEVTHEGR